MDDMMFSEDETGESAGKARSVAYRVLARKYRPSTFDDLIGQEPMVRTLTNAFKLDRIAQAYMLTGVRGVGKTTTARIIARALNYETDAVNQPTIDMPTFGIHCEAIIDSRHLDVIEMDAASHTGIDDIREIVEAVKYKPAAARYKVYIIDEVHMLSKSAFNGLLKTLEEPPEHVKFIFATTEIRKVPVTILSRCQRFDLRRIEASTMVAFLKDVAAKEGVDVAGDALAMVARVSEGSVRDALSLLDQAIAHGGGRVDAEEMRAMLGLADRGRVIDLFEHVMRGRVHPALEEIKAQVNIGADPAVILADLADFTHLVTTAKVAGSVHANGALSEAERNKAAEFAAALSIRSLSRAWQMLLSGVAEVQGANRPDAAADMVIVRLAYAADLPAPDEVLKQLRDPESSGIGTNSSGPVASSVTGPVSRTDPTPRSFSASGSPYHGRASSATASLAEAQALSAARPQTEAEPVGDRPRPVLVTSNPDPVENRLLQPQDDAALRAGLQTKGLQTKGLRINRFEDLVALAAEKRDLALRSALEKHVRLIAFENGRIEFSAMPDAPRSLASDLKARLLDWTGTPWIVLPTGEGGAEPLAAQRQEEERQRTRDAEDDPVVAEILRRFPGSRIVSVTFRDDEDKGANAHPVAELDDDHEDVHYENGDDRGSSHNKE
ncbi:MAG: DNA polymerase III subunit gamma/tau [Rhizobiales bacterium]|nr:DNA polymerase III subunit gamma/tau [Hyphomicrobiales bacterium]